MYVHIYIYIYMYIYTLVSTRLQDNHLRHPTGISVRKKNRAMCADDGARPENGRWAAEIPGQSENGISMDITYYIYDTSILYNLT